MTAVLLSLDSVQAQHPALYFWIDCFLKASLVILLAFLFHWIYRRQSASSHGLIWLIAIISCLCIPFFKLYIPDIALTIDIAQTDLPVNGSFNAGSNYQDLEKPTPLKALPITALMCVYLIGLLLMLVNLTSSIFRLFKISNQASRSDDSRLESTLQQLLQSNGITAKVTLLISSQTRTPFTWGIVHHRLVLPAAAQNWNRLLIRQAIGHELGHIQRNDWIYQLLGRITLCLYWPNPLLWYAARYLKIASEKASDDTAADCSDSDIGYASNLLQLANCIRTHDQNAQLAMQMFSSPSILALRIRHILLEDRNRSLLRADEILTATLMTLLLIVPFSSLQVSANLIEPVTVEKNYIPLTFDTVKNKLILDYGNEPKAITPPQRLHHRILAPESQHDPGERRTEFEMVAETLSVNSGGKFSLAAEELFLQWEATPLQTPAPDYPLVALRKGIEGFVVAEFNLDKNGNAINPRIIESVPTGIFDRAVLRAVEKFVYCPEIVDGIGGNNQPIRKRFSFTLRN